MPDPVTPDPDALREQGYIQGARAARVAMLRQLFDQLGYDTPTMPSAAWLLEREAAIAQLRVLCGRFGDLDWGEQLHLGDIIEKHLARHLNAPQPQLGRLQPDAPLPWLGMLASAYSEVGDDFAMKPGPVRDLVEAVKHILRANGR